jgi:ABC-type glutathione transport system ATPase component
MPGIDVDVRHLVVQRAGSPGAPILDDVSLDVPAGARHGLVGASGSGKTTLLRVLLGRVRSDRGSVRIGRFTLPVGRGGASLAFARSIGWIPQDAPGALDPSMTVRSLIEEGIALHDPVPRREREACVASLLREVGLPPDVLDRAPGELSGGQAQRVCIARALSTRPGLFLADEPTSSLDPRLQIQVLDRIHAVCESRGTTLVLVAHSLGVVRRYCRTVSVLDCGRIVERGLVATVLEHPQHQKTRELLDAERH